ncbi:MAG: HPP family protein [Thermoplasmata archaeon]
MVHIFDKKLDKKTLKHYLFQSVLATLVLFLCLNVPFIDDAVLIAAIGSTTFILFAMPKTLPARPRNVLGGHFVCGLIGIVFSMFNSGFIPNTTMLSLAVGLSILAMVTLAIEHPPAGGTVIALLFSTDYVAFVTLLLLSSIMMLFVHLLKPYMINLM